LHTIAVTVSFVEREVLWKVKSQKTKTVIEEDMDPISPVR